MVKHLLFVVLVALACSPPAISFVALPLRGNGVCGVGPAGASCAALRSNVPLSAGPRLPRHSLRMAEGEAEKKEGDAEEPAVTLTDEDLDARIAALGLGIADQPLVNRSTGEEGVYDKRSAIEKVQEDSAQLGKKALRGAASGVIAVLNQIEAPVADEDWEKLRDERDRKRAEAAKIKEGDNLIEGGGLVVVVPVVIVSGALAAWAIASEFTLF